MAVLLPAFQVDNTRVAALRATAYDNVQKIVRAARSNMTTAVRDLNATDLLFGPTPGTNIAAAVTNPAALVANTWLLNVFSNLTLLSTQACVIYGWESLSGLAHIKAVRFSNGQLPYTTVPLQLMYGFPQSVAYFNEGLYWGPGDTVQVDLLADAAVLINAEEFMPLGFICEPEGKNVTNTSTILNRIIGQQANAA